MSPEHRSKDPDEVKIFSFDWTTALNAGATVSGTNTWSVSPSGPAISSETIVAGGLQTSALIAGGTADQKYIVTNLVTTSDGETLEESGVLTVRHSSQS